MKFGLGVAIHETGGGGVMKLGFCGYPCIIDMFKKDLLYNIINFFKIY